MTIIDQYAFDGCTLLTAIIIPSSVANFGDYAFRNCSNLTAVTIAEGVSSIGNYAFQACSELESVSFPASVTSIGNYSFRNCSKLAKVYIYATSLTKYGYRAFYNNAEGRKIYVPAASVDTYKAEWSDYAADIEALPYYALTMKDGTQDADKWTVKVGDAEKTVTLPITNLKGGETVTLQYNGRLKVKSVTATTDAKPDPLATPLTIEAITAGSIIVANPKAGMQYSLDGGKTKNAVTTDDIVLNAGDKVQFYGNGTTITSYGASSVSDCTQITGSGDGFTCKVYGNIMSLVDEEGFATATTLSGSYNFKYLFKGNAFLTDASGLLLPATKLASYCYYQMFMGCSSLTAAPELPAPTLVSSCYYMMFSGCSKLATVTCLATSGINANNSTSNWLSSAGSQVEGTKTVYTVKSASWPEGKYSGIPTGWTRVNVDN